MIKAVIFDMYETLVTLFESPMYFSKDMAKDAGIDSVVFKEAWSKTITDRTLGLVTYEDVIKKILKDNDCFTQETLLLLSKKRTECKAEVFNHMNPEIILMLNTLKEKGLKIGLISNCFSEEAKVIKESVLFPYFDAIMLSFDEKICKPDTRIFIRCLEKLNLAADECLYIGDGGSQELETAASLNMKTAQAVWYLKDGYEQPVSRLDGYIHLESPMEVLRLI